MCGLGGQRLRGAELERKARSLQAFRRTPRRIHSCGEVASPLRRFAGEQQLVVLARCGQRVEELLVYTGFSAWLLYLFRATSHCEADLPAERAPPETPARLSCPDGHSSWTRDPQAAPCEGAQAPLCLTRASGPRRTCSAGTVSRARGTSTRSTGRAARSRRASSSSTPSRVTTTGRRASGSPFLAGPAAPSSGTASSDSSARCGARDCRRFRSAATTF